MPSSDPMPSWARQWTPGTDSSSMSVSSATPSDHSRSSSASGFFITGEGHFITASHAVAGATSILVNTSQGLVGARLLAADPANDVAILKVTNVMDRPFPALAIPEKPKVRLGQGVFTIGFPNPSLQGINPKLAKGEIAGLSGLQDDPRIYQVSLPVQPGNSGGVLADDQGNVIGLIISKLSSLAGVILTGELPQNVNYALKASYARLLIDTVPDLSDKLPSPATEQLTFDAAVQKVQDASALVFSFGQTD